MSLSDNPLCRPTTRAGKAKLLKCCPPDESYSSANSNCSPGNLSRALKETWSLNFANFSIAYGGLSCNSTIILNRSGEQDYCLHENGSLLEHRRKVWHRISRFCFDYMDGEIQPMVCIDQDDLVDERLRYIGSTVGMAISMVFLLLTFGLYLATPALRRSVRDRSLLSYVVALIFGFAFFNAAQNIPTGPFCTFVAYMTQYWLLAAFFWLNIICIDIWAVVKTKKHIKQLSGRRFTFYSLYAWGCPFAVSIVTVFADIFLEKGCWKPGLGEQECWFQKNNCYRNHFYLQPRFLYFYCMITFTLVSNVCLFCFTAIFILSKNKKWPPNPDSQRHKQDWKWFKSYLKLFLMMGLSWLLDMASYCSDEVPDTLSILFMVNYLQGAVIFGVFVCNEKVIRLLRNRFYSKNAAYRGFGGFKSTENRKSTFSRVSTISRPSCEQEINPPEDRILISAGYC